jgi:hypothetical protein
LFGTHPRRSITQTLATRKDGVVSDSAEACVVCHRARRRRSFRTDDDTFICADCRTAADQLIAIQDDLWPKPTHDGSPSD